MRPYGRRAVVQGSTKPHGSHCKICYPENVSKSRERSLPYDDDHEETSLPEQEEGISIPAP
jgi:hypothetical protein